MFVRQAKLKTITNPFYMVKCVSCISMELQQLPGGVAATLASGEVSAGAHCPSGLLEHNRVCPTQ